MKGVVVFVVDVEGVDVVVVFRDGFGILKTSFLSVDSDDDGNLKVVIVAGILFFELEDSEILIP